MKDNSFIFPLRKYKLKLIILTIYQCKDHLCGANTFLWGKFRPEFLPESEFKPKLGRTKALNLSHDLDISQGCFYKKGSVTDEQNNPSRYQHRCLTVSRLYGNPTDQQDTPYNSIPFIQSCNQ